MQNANMIILSHGRIVVDSGKIWQAQKPSQSLCPSFRLSLVIGQGYGTGLRYYGTIDRCASIDIIALCASIFI